MQPECWNHIGIKFHFHDNLDDNTFCFSWLKCCIPVKAVNPFSSCQLTVAINSEGCAGCSDLVVTDLAVLWGAVLVGGLNLQDAVVNLALCYCCSVLGLPKHWGKLVHIIDLNVHHRPVDNRGTQRGEKSRLMGMSAQSMVAYFLIHERQKT